MWNDSRFTPAADGGLGRKKGQKEENSGACLPLCFLQHKVIQCKRLLFLLLNKIMTGKHMKYIERKKVSSKENRNKKHQSSSKKLNAEHENFQNKKYI